MSDLLRCWGSLLSADNRSFRAVANRTVHLSTSALDAVRSGGGLIVAKGDLLAFVWPRRGITTLGSAAALAVFCTSIYFAVGYVHYKRAAIDERVAAQRAEQTNADLQDALDRVRDELAVTKVRIDSPSEGTLLAASEQYKPDRMAQLIRALEQPRDLRLTDTQRPTLTAGLSWKTTALAEETLRHLNAERDEAVGERDQLRVRVSDLEQELSLLHAQRGPRQAAKSATTRTAAPPRAPADAAAIAPASAPAVVAPASERRRQVAVVFPTKNFTPPDWVPTYFGDGGTLIHENSTRRPAESRPKD
jgi:hypothetical protein